MITTNMINQDVAKILYDIAEIKQHQNDNKFSIGAYRKAAKFISNLPTPVSELDLLTTKGIGPKIANSILEFLSTGKVQFIVDNQACLNASQKVEELLRIEGIGEKKALKIYETLGISMIAELKVAIENGKLAQVFKDKTIENIKQGIEYLETTRGRIRLDEALELIVQIHSELREFCDRIEFCGSFRRSKSTIGDIDFAVVSSDSDFLQRFATLPIVDKIINIGKKKASVWVKGIRIDCYIFEADTFESGVMHLTGSADHNEELRRIAKSKGLILSQYGLYRRFGDERTGDRLDDGTETSIYNSLGFNFIPPEHRDDVSQFGKYRIDQPAVNLLKADDIECDFHTHSTWSDGKSTIEEMVQTAIKLGLKSIAITDHSQVISTKVLAVDIKRKIGEIEVLRMKYPTIKILMGSEVNIKSDGSLDYSDEILDQLDIVIASIHVHTKQDVTEMYCKAIRTGKVHIIGHLTGRLINQRPGHVMNVEAILQECRNHNVAIEFNCQPDRLDADEDVIRRCKDMGIKIAIGSDAHEKSQIQYSKTFGLWIGRRAWLTKNDLLEA
jgi:DNA polymerase (family 10)